VDSYLGKIKTVLLLQKLILLNFYSSTPDISFTINTQFPNRVLEDDSQTLADAGLLNCVIIQKRT
jgi:hypothetical protein